MKPKVTVLTPVATTIKISDGSVWTVPTPDLNGNGSLAWKLIFTDFQIEGNDRLMLASLLESYGALIDLPTDKLAIKKIKKIREAVRFIRYEKETN